MDKLNASSLVALHYFLKVQMTMHFWGKKSLKLTDQNKGAVEN